MRPLRRFAHRSIKTTGSPVREPVPECGGIGAISSARNEYFPSRAFAYEGFALLHRTAPKKHITALALQVVRTSWTRRSDERPHTPS